MSDKYPSYADNCRINIGTFRSAWEIVAKSTELEDIRNALGLTQEEFAPLLGANAHSTYHRWENSPDTPSGRKALEKARAVYLKRKGRPWEAPQDPGKSYVTREEYGALDARLETLRKDLEVEKRKVFALQGAIRQLAKAAGLHHLVEPTE